MNEECGPRDTFSAAESGNHADLDKVTRLTSDEEFLKMSLIPLGFSAVLQLIFSCMISQASNSKDPLLWLLLFVLFGLQLCHVGVTLKTVIDFSSVERSPSEFMSFFERSWDFLLLRCIIDVMLIILLGAAYSDPLLVELEAVNPLTDLGKRTIFGFCMITVLLDLALAARALSVIFVPTIEVRPCSAIGFHVCGLLRVLDLGSQYGENVLSFAYVFMIYVLSGLCTHLQLKYIDVQISFLVASIVLSVLRYLQKGETLFSKCFLFSCYALYLVKLCATVVYIL